MRWARLDSVTGRQDAAGAAPQQSWRRPAVRKPMACRQAQRPSPRPHFACFRGRPLFPIYCSFLRVLRVFFAWRRIGIVLG